MNLLDLLSVVVALYLCLRLADRLRLINWYTTKPLYVGLYVSHMVWALGIMYSVFHSGVLWHQVFGLTAMFFWLEVTRDYWVCGPPEEVTKPAYLGEPELQPAMHRRKGDPR